MARGVLNISERRGPLTEGKLDELIKEFGRETHYGPEFIEVRKTQAEEIEAEFGVTRDAENEPITFGRLGTYCGCKMMVVDTPYDLVVRQHDAIRMLVASHHYGEDIGHLDSLEEDNEERYGGLDDWHCEDLFKRKLLSQHAIGDSGEYATDMTEKGQRAVKEALAEGLIFADDRA